MTDETTDTAEMTDDQFEEYLDAEDAAAESEINAQDSADLGDDDDSPANLHAGLALSAADRDDVGGVDEDEDADEIPEITVEQLASDERIREANRSDPRRVIDNLDEEVGPKIAAARWSQYHESTRQENVDATSADVEAEREAAAIERVAQYIQAEDESNDAGFISGPGSEHDADDAKRRFANAKDRWRDWCADPNN